MKIKPIGHEDLIKRIQNSAIEAGMPDEIAREIGEPDGRDPWQGFGEEPDEQFRRWEGSRRWEVLVPVSKILSTFRKLFKRGKK